MAPTTDTTMAFRTHPRGLLSGFRMGMAAKPMGRGTKTSKSQVHLTVLRLAEWRSNSNCNSNTAWLNQGMACQATATPVDAVAEEIDIAFDGSTDPTATLLHISGKDCSSLLEPLSRALQAQELIVLSATVNPTDGVFRIMGQNGRKVPQRRWSDCSKKIHEYLASARIFSNKPLVYGEVCSFVDSKPVRPIAQAFNMEDVSALRHTANEVARAAKKLAKIEQDIVNMLKRGNNGPKLSKKQADRSELAALLDRPLLKLEAMLAMRRTSQISSELEEEKGEGADLRFQAGGGTSTGPASGSGHEIILQAFNWDSHYQDWYKIIAAQARDYLRLGFTSVWLPPPSDSVTPQGYLPRDLYCLDSCYGSEADLRDCISQLHMAGLKVLADIVINHRCAQYQGEDGKWNKFGGRLPWDATAICSGNSEWQGRGNPKQGDEYVAAPNIDHANPKIREDIINWMRYLRKSVGFDGWRFDFVKGYPGSYLKMYIDATVPEIAVGEYWDSLEYSDFVLHYNQDNHRQRAINWCDSTGGASSAFDFTTKGILQEAVGRQEYWRLVDPEGRPPGLIGMWPSRAVCFVDNHDTGSSLQHWPFPRHALCQGYAYILTHPGTPCVFYDHLWQEKDGVKKCIQDLLAIRKRNDINCRSTIKIPKATAEVYAAVTDSRVAMKIGPGKWSPNHDDNLKSMIGSKNWQLSTFGTDFAVWEAET